METRILRKESLLTSKWSGGTTTQLAICPHGALYAERDFVWRVSTAKVEVEESVFTTLPGVRRVLMVLQGQMHLSHEGHHRVDLERFDQDSFHGDWLTTSRGKVTDFNLMIAQGDGSVSAIQIPPSATSELQLGSQGENQQWSLTSHVVYFLAPAEVILPDEEPLSMQSGDVLICSENLQNISSGFKIGIVNHASTTAHVIKASVGHD